MDTVIQQAWRVLRIAKQNRLELSHWEINTWLWRELWIEIPRKVDIRIGDEPEFVMSLFGVPVKVSTSYTGITLIHTKTVSAQPSADLR